MAGNVLQDLKIQPGGFLNYPWREYITHDGVSGEHTWGPDASQAVMTIDVYWADYVRGAAFTFSKNGLVPQLLGWSQVIQDKDSNGKDYAYLTRGVPAFHPVFPWLRARSINGARGMKFTGKFVGGNFGPYADFQYARLPIVFQSVPWRLIPDSEMPILALPPGAMPWVGTKYPFNEFARSVQKLYEPTGEFITREDGDFIFAEGPLGPGAANDPKPFRQGRGQILTKANVKWIWKDLPYNCVYDSNGTLSPNLVQSEGRLNSSWWPDPVNKKGYPPGTLLIEPVQVHEKTAPVPPDMAGLAQYQDAPLFYDVEMNSRQFDPKSGGAFRGHNLVPSPQDNLWYLGVLNPVTAGGSPPVGPVTITVLTVNGAGTVATAVVVAGHGFTNGATVIVDGAAAPEYNGDFVITVIDAVTFTYNISGNTIPGVPTTSPDLNGGAINAFQGIPLYRYTNVRKMFTPALQDGSNVWR